MRRNLSKGFQSQLGETMRVADLLSLGVSASIDLPDGSLATAPGRSSGCIDSPMMVFHCTMWKSRKINWQYAEQDSKHMDDGEGQL